MSWETQDPIPKRTNAAPREKKIELSKSGETKNWQGAHDKTEMRDSDRFGNGHTRWAAYFPYLFYTSFLTTHD